MLAGPNPPSFGSPVVKLFPWPSTTTAGPPAQGKTLLQAANGFAYSSTRLLSVSATYRLPNPSTATPSGKQRLPALISVPLAPLQKYDRKSGCPITRSAGAPLTNDPVFFHPSARLLLKSAT